MTSGPTPETNDQDVAWARPLYRRQIDFLGELADKGMEIARDIADRSRAAQDLKTAQACATAYARIARAVRMTLLLQSRFIKELEAFGRQGGHPPLVGREAEITRISDHAAAAETESEERETLGGEAGDRLDHDDIYRQVQTRPVSELIAMICKDLGLPPDWRGLAGGAPARQQAKDAASGPPFAARPPDAAAGVSEDPLERIKFRSSA